MPASLIHRLTAATLLACCCGSAHADYYVKHTFSIRPGGNIAPTVNWIHREYARSQQDRAIDLCDPGQISTPVGLGWFSSFPNCSTRVGSTFAWSRNWCTITNIAPRDVSGTIETFGNAKARLDPGVRRAKALAWSGAVVGATANRDLGRGRIVQGRTVYCRPIRGSTGTKTVMRDPVTIHVRDLNTGAETTHTLLTITGGTTQSTLTWDNNLLTLGSGGNHTGAHLVIDMSSPITTQQGRFELEVRNGFVHRSSATGLFAGTPMPPVGSPVPAGGVSVPLATETTLDYDAGLAPDANVEVTASVDQGGREEDAAARDWGNPTSVTNVFETPARVCVADVVTPNTTFAVPMTSPAPIACLISPPADGITMHALNLEVIRPTRSDVSGAVVRVLRIPPTGGPAQILDERFVPAQDITFDDHSALRRNANGSSPVPIELVSLSLQSVNPIFIPPSPNTFVSVELMPLQPTGQIQAVPSALRQGLPSTRIETMQFVPSMNQWRPCIDQGSGMPIMLPITIASNRRECVADFNADGFVDFNDYLEFLNLYNANDPWADLNTDGTVDFNDYLEFLNLYNQGCE